MVEFISRSDVPKVSIVVPVYNHEEYIEETILSVLNQSYKNIECIVVDDGSTDNSSSIIEKYSNQIKIITQNNQGQAVALNNGWSFSSGEILCYLSSDDLIDQNAISSLVQEMCNMDQPSVVFPKYRLIDSYSNIIKEVNIPFSCYEDMMQTFTCPIGPGALFDRSLFARFGGWDTTLRQIPDFEFWLRIGKSAELKMVSEFLSSFRVHATSQTFIFSDYKKADESLYVAKKIISSNQLTVNSKNKFTASAYCFSSCLHLRSGRIFVGIKRFYQGVTFDPVASLSIKTIKRIFAACFSRFLYKSR